MTDLNTDFIFLEFHKQKLEPRQGLVLLCEALCMALAGASDREDLDRNVRAMQIAIGEGALLYYESTKDARLHLLENPEILKTFIEKINDENKTTEA